MFVSLCIWSCVTCIKANITLLNSLCLYLFPWLHVFTYKLVILWHLYKHHPPNMSPHSQKLIQETRCGSQKKLNCADAEIQWRLLCVVKKTYTAINLLYKTTTNSLYTHLLTWNECMYRNLHLSCLCKCKLNIN